ncbi:MAG: hypothetical protein U1G07_02400 [Verrucomicrobiota bacterium]
MKRFQLAFIALWLSGAAWLFLSQRTDLEKLRPAGRARRAMTNSASTPVSRTGPAIESRAPSSELLRLRGEVGVLRRELALTGATDSDDDTQRTNDWLAVYSGFKPSELPGFRYYRQLTDVGFATPEAALQSFQYAAGHQQEEPPTNTRMKDFWDVPDDFDQEPGYNIHLGEGFYGGIGYRVAGQEFLATNVVRLTIDYEKEDGSSYRRDKILVQTNGRWRMKPQAVTRAEPNRSNGSNLDR